MAVIPASSAGVTTLSGTFAGTGVSNSVVVQYGYAVFNLWATPLSGGLSAAFSATVSLERSLDNGTTWIPVSESGAGTPATYTAAVAINFFEPVGALYRVDCTAYTSGTVTYRIDQRSPSVRNAS